MTRHIQLGIQHLLNWSGGMLDQIAQDIHDEWDRSNPSATQYHFDQLRQFHRDFSRAISLLERCEFKTAALNSEFKMMRGIAMTLQNSYADFVRTDPMSFFAMAPSTLETIVSSMDALKREIEELIPEK